MRRCISFVTLLFVAFAVFWSSRSGKLQGHSLVVPLATAPLDVSIVEIEARIRSLFFLTSDIVAFPHLNSAISNDGFSPFCNLWSICHFASSVNTSHFLLPAYPMLSLVYCILSVYIVKCMLLLLIIY